MKPSARLRALHFTGIGGSGMSALAEVLHGSGFIVRGSDRVEGRAVRHLRSLGVSVTQGHAAANVAPDCDALVFTAAVDAGNPELAEARARNIPVVRRADLLGLAMAGRHGLAVAGTHGKSTTTGMLIHILRAAGSEPGWAVGAAWKDGAPGHAGRGDFFAVEADEYDRAFLSLRPVSAIVTNIDADHLDYYGSLGAIEDAFVAFLNGLPFHGIAVLNAEDSGIRRVADRLACRTTTYGLAAGDYRVRDAVATSSGTGFSLVRRGEVLGRVDLKVLGQYNVSNAVAAAALALEEGVPFSMVAEGLASFPGMERRLETVGARAGVTVLDDYAHHPAEVAAAIQALRPLVGPAGRLVVVFQPHLYSRTQQLAGAFAEAFLGCDRLHVLPVYAARENPVPGVEGDLVVAEAARLGHADARFEVAESPQRVAGRVASGLRKDDVCVTMGAGDVGALAPLVLEAVS